MNQALPQAAVSKLRQLTLPFRAGGALAGGAVLLASMTIVNAGNYVFNLLLGRWLGPAAFADLSLVITIMLVITLVTTTFQTVSARFAAVYAANGQAEQTTALRAWLSRWAWGLGVVLLAVCVLGAPFWQWFFQTASPWPFVLLGLALPLYLPLGIDRGVLQGQTRFGALALNFQIEMWVRLTGAVALVALGWSVSGAVAGVTLSLAAAWLAGRRALAAGAHSPAPLDAGERAAVRSFCGPVAAALIGQVLINNSDILMVKHFFAAEAAGHYAALALTGRIVFFATSAAVAALFPVVAQRQQRGEPHRHLLWAALGLVALVSLVLIGAVLAAPALAVDLLFGAAYMPIAPLLWQYGVATMVYALANVVISYRLAVGSGDGGGLAVLAGIGQVLGLWLFHSSLAEVVLVQIALMLGLLAGLLVWNRQLTQQAVALARCFGRALLGRRARARLG